MTVSPRRRTRPVVVVAAPGVDTGVLAEALAAATGRRVLAGGRDLLETVPRLHPAHRGWDGERLGRQDAKPAVVSELEAAWTARAGVESADGLILAYPQAALHVPFLRAGWPDARFVHVEGDREAACTVLGATWEAAAGGELPELPELPDWDGPAWSGPLTPGWRALRGAPLADLVAAQHDTALQLLRDDLSDLPPGSWISVRGDALRDDAAGEADRVARFLRTAPEREGEGAALSPFRSTGTTTFAALLDQLGSSLVVTTYQTGRVVIARTVQGRLNTHFRQRPSPMGIAYRPGLLTIGTKGAVETYADLPGLAAGLTPDGRHDACFVPRRTHYTGDIRVHDVAWAGEELWAVATRFSCLVTLDDRHSFVPRWAPSFITELAAEDRCHLNGLAVVDERVRFVTALGTTDTQGGWRASKADGGVVIDVESGDIVVGGLSMPHSPRWYRDRLWILESGQGRLCRVDLATGTVETVAELPGFTRGLAFAGRYAFVGLSEVREATTFGGLPLTARLEDRQCGVWVVDIETGRTVGYLRFDDAVQEIFDVALLPGIRFPELLDPSSPAVLDAFMVPPPR